MLERHRVRHLEARRTAAVRSDVPHASLRVVSSGNHPVPCMAWRTPVQVDDTHHTIALAAAHSVYAFDGCVSCLNSRLILNIIQLHTRSHTRARTHTLTRAHASIIRCRSNVFGRCTALYLLIGRPQNFGKEFVYSAIKRYSHARQEAYWLPRWCRCVSTATLAARAQETQTCVVVRRAGGCR